jgi:hypothetical protein
MLAKIESAKDTGHNLPSSVGKSFAAKSRNVLDKRWRVLFLSLAIQDVKKNCPENNRLSSVSWENMVEF